MDRIDVEKRVGSFNCGHAYVLSAGRFLLQLHVTNTVLYDHRPGVVYDPSRIWCCALIFTYYGISSVRARDPEIVL